MKKILKKISAVLLILCFCMSMISSPVFANTYSDSLVLTALAEQTGVIVDEEETYNITLKADDSSYPMPAGSSNGTYTLKALGNQQTDFPEIIYDTLGVYTYTIHQQAGSNEFATYDDTLYTLTVSVINDTKSGGIKAVPAIHKYGDSKDKKYDIVFNNDYANPYTELTVKKVWEGDGDELDKRPESIKVQLLNDNQVQEVVTLTESDGWMYTWENLSIKGSWSVKEIDIPVGYENTSTAAGESSNTIIITNTKLNDKLEQTGQLNWPVPVLAALGTTLIICGLVMGRKKRNDA